MKTAAALLIVIASLCLPALAIPYSHVQATAEVSTSPVSRFVAVRVHLRNLGGIATSCVVKASGQKRITGISADGVADVTFDSLSSYKGYSVACEVN